jgi:hypothetical protein
MKICPKCGFENELVTPVCLKCGVIFAKVDQGAAVGGITAGESQPGRFGLVSRAVILSS